MRAPGDLRTAPLREASARDARPGLARDFFAEQPIGPAPPPIEVTAGER